MRVREQSPRLSLVAVMVRVIVWFMLPTPPEKVVFKKGRVKMGNVQTGGLAEKVLAAHRPWQGRGKQCAVVDELAKDGMLSAVDAVAWWTIFALHLPPRVADAE
jgi:hypothetical protein